MDEEDGRPGALAAKCRPAGRPQGRPPAVPASRQIFQADHSLCLSSNFWAVSKAHGRALSSGALANNAQPPFKPQLQRPKAIGPTAGGGGEQKCKRPRTVTSPPYLSLDIRTAP